jgi:hypothetical protein
VQLQVPSVIAFVTLRALIPVPLDTFSQSDPFIDGFASRTSRDPIYFTVYNLQPTPYREQIFEVTIAILTDVNNASFSLENSTLALAASIQANPMFGNITILDVSVCFNSSCQLEPPVTHVTQGETTGTSKNE